MITVSISSLPRAIGTSTVGGVARRRAFDCARDCVLAIAFAFAFATRIARALASARGRVRSAARVGARRAHVRRGAPPSRARARVARASTSPSIDES